MPEVIKSLLRSRKFVVSIAALVSVIIVMAIPNLEQHQEFLRNGIIALAGLLIGTWGIEDFATKIKGSTIPKDAEDILTVLQDIIKVLADRELPPSPEDDQFKG